MQLLNRRQTLIALGTAIQLGCGSAGGLVDGDGDGDRDGEHVSYSLWNVSGIEVQAAELRGVSPSEGLASYLVQRAGAASSGWQGGGGTHLPDAGHRIPERVILSWRQLPRLGQKTYEGDLVGPFDLQLRSRIPPDVLAKLRSNTKLRLEMALSVGVQPIQLRWRLIEADLRSSSSRAEVRRGGDW